MKKHGNMDDRALKAIIGAYRAQLAQADTPARAAALDRLARSICAQAARTPQAPAPWRWAGMDWQWLVPNVAGMAAALLAGFFLARTAPAIDMMDTADLVLNMETALPVWEEGAL